MPAVRKLASRLKFIDESGANLGLTRTFGRAAPGERVCEATPGVSGTHYTVIASLSVQAIEATWLLEGAMTGETFDYYVAQILCPTLRKGDLVFIDNLNVHKSAHVRALIEGCGAQLDFLPPYSPDFNPIEQCWSKIKTVLRKRKARTFDELVEAMCFAFESISPKDARAWFTYCGYL